MSAGEQALSGVDPWEAREKEISLQEQQLKSTLLNERNWKLSRHERAAILVLWRRQRGAHVDSVSGRLPYRQLRRLRRLGLVRFVRMEWLWMSGTGFVLTPAGQIVAKLLRESAS